MASRVSDRNKGILCKIRDILTVLNYERRSITEINIFLFKNGHNLILSPIVQINLQLQEIIKVSINLMSYLYQIKDFGPRPRPLCAENTNKSTP